MISIRFIIRKSLTMNRGSFNRRVAKAIHRTAIAVGLALALWPLVLSPKLSAQLIGQPTTLTLTDAVTQTLANNPVSLAAWSHFKQAQANVEGARSSQRFQVTFNTQSSVSSATVIQPPPNGETFGAIQSSLTVPIPIGPKYNLAVRQASDQVSAAQAIFQSAEIALADKVASAYYGLLKAEALSKAAKDDLDAAQQELTDATLRNRAGDIAALDVEEAQVPVAEDQAALLTSQSMESESLETLNSLLGRPLDLNVILDDVSFAPTSPPYSMEEARGKASAASPEVAAADATVEADENALALSKRYRDPAVALQAIDLRSGDQTAFSREDTLQASLTVPLEDGGHGQSVVQAAAAALAGARQDAIAARTSAASRVSELFLSVQSSVAETAAAASARDIAQSVYDKTKLGYASGLYPLEDVIIAGANASRAHTDYIQVLYDATDEQYALDATVNGIKIVQEVSTTWH
jgi:outer membrane protein